MITTKALGVLALVATAAAAAGPREESVVARAEAKEIVEQAYHMSRTYCAMYPHATHTVVVVGEDYEIELTVRCDVVNRYFRGVTLKEPITRAE